MNRKMHILLVEDEPNFGSVMKDYLQLNGFEVIWCKDGLEGLACFRTSTVDLCILDVMMPKMDGFSLGKEIRNLNPDMPLIFLTAKSLPEDIIEGFRLGADDYITKPFHSEELLYRIKAILKRTNASLNGTPVPSEFEIGQFLFDPNLRIIHSESIEHKLSPKESELLALLCQKRPQLLTRQEALNKIWKDDNYFNARSMDVFVTKLRKRFKSDPSIRIENIHGKGFQLLVEK